MRCRRRAEPPGDVWRAGRLAAAVALAAVFLAGGVGVAAQGPTYELGRPPTADELQPPGAAIGPDGRGLPPGSGTAAEGALLYVARGCSGCHGPTGAEGPGPHLVGPRGAGNTHYDAAYEGGNWQGRGIANFMFAPQIWSWINQGMPLNQQGFLTADEVYSLTAYLLHRNGIVEEDDVLDAESLPRVRMPARGTFAYTPDHPAFAAWTPGMPRRRAR